MVYPSEIMTLMAWLAMLISYDFSFSLKSLYATNIGCSFFKLSRACAYLQPASTLERDQLSTCSAMTSITSLIKLISIS
eukprot:13641_6